MNIQEQIQGAVTVIRPQGALAQDDIAEFHQRVTDAIRKSLGRVVIDVAGVPFMDSTGLEALLDASDKLAAGGRALKICSLNDMLREVLDLTDLAQSFDIYEDVNTAVRSFI